MRQNTFAASGPAGELISLPRPPSWIWGKNGKGAWQGQGKGREKDKGREGEWNDWNRGGKFNFIFGFRGIDDRPCAREGFKGTSGSRQVT